MSRFFRRGGDSSDSSSSDEEEELLSQDESENEAPKPSKPAAPTGGAKPMSRFLRTEGSDSESEESESESDESEEEGDEGEKPTKKVSRFLKGAASDDSEEESVKHIVKSAKDKRLEEMEASGSLIDQKLKINDWAAVNTGMLP